MWKRRLDQTKRLESEIVEKLSYEQDITQIMGEKKKIRPDAVSNRLYPPSVRHSMKGIDARLVP